MIDNKFIAKIEGHGSLDINWDENTAILEVNEGERLFEGILVGRTLEEAHWITPRICGVCPVAHNLASLKAGEDALGIKTDKATVLLRELLNVAQMLQSHVLHLFFLVLPDYIGIDNPLELAQKDPDNFKKALLLKEISDNIACVIGGRNVHPTTTTLGGFHKVPSKNDLQKLLNKLNSAKGAVAAAGEIFANITYPELKTEINLIAHRNNTDYGSYDANQVKSNTLKGSYVKDYRDNIKEEIRSYSTAKFSKYQGKGFMVGSLARIIVNKDRLSKNAQKLLSEVEIDANNPYHNIIAQAVEIIHYHDHSIELINKLLDTDIKQALSKKKARNGKQGIGSVEAPRGSLYHEYKMDKNGIITSANIITPTAQNLTSIEKSVQDLMDQTTNLSAKERKRLIKMLVRAYDPCLSCSVH